MLEKLLIGLEHLVRHIQGPFILIWDRSRTHRAKIVKTFLEKHPQIQVEYLPAYAPDAQSGGVLPWKCQVPHEKCHFPLENRNPQNFGSGLLPIT